MAETTTTEQQAPPEPAKTRKEKPSTDTRPKRQPPYAVVLHNDPVNDFQYVIRVLQKVFRYGGGKCFWLTFRRTSPAVASSGPARSKSRS